MRHVISVLMANEAGALVRVAGMFSQRGFNIETLNVAPTEDAAVSRLTLVTSGTGNIIEQIVRQLLKLVDVIDVLNMTAIEHAELELALIKIPVDADRDDLARVIGHADVSPLDDLDDVRMLRVLGAGDALDDLLAALSAANMLYSHVRSGTVALARGEKTLQYPQARAIKTTAVD